MAPRLVGVDGGKDTDDSSVRERECTAQGTVAFHVSLRNSNHLLG